MTFLTLSLVLGPAGVASATQGHGGIEGIYAHQLAHLFFIFSMGLLIYWLRQRRLNRQAGWRFIQYAALCFIVWNLDAMLVHGLEEQLTAVTTTRIGLWQIQIHSSPDTAWLKYFYYATKLDHLFCVPAMGFLYAGLKHLLAEPQREASEREQP
jgi:hypothetical protein